MMQLDDLHLQQAQAVRRPTLLNIAAAQLRKVGRLPQPESQCCKSAAQLCTLPLRAPE